MEKQKKLHFLLMVPFLFLLANSVLIDVYAIKETEIGDHVNLSRKNPNNEVRIRRLGKQLVRIPEDKFSKSITPDGGRGTSLSMTDPPTETGIGNHVSFSRKNLNNEVRRRRLAKQLVRKPEDEFSKSITPDGGRGTLFVTDPPTNRPAAAPSAFPQKTDPAGLPIESKPWHMPLWGWILIGFAIVVLVLVIAWVVWYYCSHHATARTSGNQNGSTELDDVESLSSSTIDNIYNNIFRVPNPDASATPPSDPAILPNRARPWQAIFPVILLIAGAIWYYYSHYGDTEPDKPSLPT